MFGKKECKTCGEKISKKHKFCPLCGNPQNKKAKKEDFGMLGKNDEDEFENAYNSMFGGIGGKMMNKMFESAVRMLEKEMQKEVSRKNPEPRTNFQLFINGKRIDASPQKITREKIGNNAKGMYLPQKTLKKFSELPKKEPSTNVRRFSDKVVYEINIPGVKTEDDISITKLENSIEIKAVAKDKAYQKIIPVNLPVTDYNLSKGKLVLELSGE